MQYGIGIIGCGMISRFHARAISEIDNLRLVGCVSHRTESAQKLAEETNCKCYHSVDELVQDPDIHIVAICTPSGNHLEPALAAIDAGKHLLIEKPLEVTPARCDQLIHAAKEKGVLVSTVFQSRFHPASQELKQAVDQQRFGNLTMGDAYVKWYRSQEYYDSGAWRGTWALDGGGALMNQAIHSVDLLLWFMGPVVEVRAHVGTLAHERIEVEDVAVASLRFANGAFGTIEATTAAFPGLLKRIEIHGTQGSVILEEEDIRFWKFAEETEQDEVIRDKFSAQTQTGGGAGDPAAIGHHGHRAQIQNLIQSIENGTPLVIDGQEGKRSVELICAIYEAAKTGATVTL
tara:strand:- start:719 stop:1759 length:1041 start_codon:yes stop_codon:yes gene_type:complete